jgi:hypothetical protein
MMSHDLEKKSRIDRDYQKWGYEKKTDSAVKNSVTAKSFFHSIDWKSPNLDFESAEKIAADFKKGGEEHFMISPWDLGVPELAEFSMDQRLRIKEKDLRPVRNKNKGLVDSYIDKKLSL